MANKSVEICLECPDKYNTTEKDVFDVKTRQNELDNVVVESSRCLGVCALLGNKRPEGGVLNVRVSGEGLERKPGVVFRTANSTLKTELIPTLPAETPSVRHRED